MQSDRSLIERRSILYELIIWILTVIALVNLIFIYFLPKEYIIYNLCTTVDYLFSLIFLADFFICLNLSQDRRSYLKWGWLDLLGAVPGFPLLRITRLRRLASISRHLRMDKYQDVLLEIRQKRARSILQITLFIALVVLLAVSIVIMDVESSSPGANIKTAEDAIWWAFVTITTVGYGDHYPVTTLGRLLAALLMTVGVGLFGVFTSYMASIFLSPKDQSQADIQTLTDKIERIEKLLEERN